MALEYPEMTNITRQMREVLPGRRVAGVHVKDNGMSVIRWGFCNLHTVDITGRQIGGISQFGDYIFIEMDGSLLMFGEMIGKILFHEAGEKRLPNSAAVIELDDRTALSFTPSLYGFCRVITPAEKEKYARNSWVQPLDDAFNAEYMAQIWTVPERKIAKQMNMFDVKYKAAGISLGYWQEILFLSGIHPQRKAQEITPDELARLVSNSKLVIQAALDQKGSTDEVDLFGAKGGYTRRMGGKLKGQPCSVCGTIIEGKSILGAKVYFCPHCQK